MSGIHLACDLSELTAVWGAEVPDVFVTCAIAIPDANLSRLLEEVRQTKSQITGTPDHPVKWNMRDIRRALKIHGLTCEESRILGFSDELRGGLLRLLPRSNARLFLSCVLAYSNDKRVLRRTREDLLIFSFANLLMRAGLYKKDLGVEIGVQVLLDWPEKRDPMPFVTEYVAAWRDGSDTAGQTYFCGPLRDLKFAPGLHFAVTDTEPILQLTDLVVGAFRSFLEFAMSKRPQTDFGVEAFARILPCIHRNQLGAIVGYGIAVSPRESGLCSLIEKGLSALCPPVGLVGTSASPAIATDFSRPKSTRS